jgi:hypothetical protein
MGSVDPGYGTAFLARVVGEKKAREIWYLCRRYRRRGRGHGPGQRGACRTTSSTPKCRVVPTTIMERAPPRWRSPSAAFNMDTAHQAGIAGMGMYALKLYYDTDESREGVKCASRKSASPSSASTPSKNRRWRMGRCLDRGARAAAASDSRMPPNAGRPNPYIDDDLMQAWPSTPAALPAGGWRPASWSATTPACSTAR